MDYALLILGFIATVLAIRGNTWNSDRTGFKKVTVVGSITLVVALCALILASIKTSKDDIKKTEHLTRINGLLKTVNNLESKLTNSEALLTTANDSIKSMGQQISGYKYLLIELHKQSERQIQWSFLNAYGIRPTESKVMPNRLYSGTLLKFVGNCDGLELRYSSRTLEIPSFDYSNSLEVPIIGTSGKSYNWSIKNTSYTQCNFKIYARSTPRSRSKDWSWLEEAN